MTYSLNRRHFLAGAGVASGLAVSGIIANRPAAAAIQSRQGRLEVTPMAEGLTVPWGLGFLPDGSFLVTERGGRLYRVDEAGRQVRVMGTPEVWASGQGGLLDVMIPRDFESSRAVFLTYAKPQGGGSAGTAMGVGRLDEAGRSLSDFRDLFEMTPGGGRGQHFGSRVIEAPDGRLFVTIGDRGEGPLAQDLARHNGSVVRINRDGSVPEDNPFVGQPGIRPEIWSYGHRNPQGAALDGDGQLWTIEHGARGGDELNRIEPGVNYGWPVISYGTNYDGSRIGIGTEAEGLAQPVTYWDPSIAPSGLMFYSGALWPEWTGAIFAGSLKFDYISRLDPDARGEERLSGPETGRVRDVLEAPDGTIWFLSEDAGAVFRVSPG